MDCWSVGVLECWSVGALEGRSVGRVECWSVARLGLDIVLFSVFQHSTTPALQYLSFSALYHSSFSSCAIAG